MARIRTIKPDAFYSETLCEVPRGTRWTFAGLWTYADDMGRGRDDARLVKAALYPIDDDVTLEDVETDLWLLTGIGAICRYVVDGRNYLHMPAWGHQKINRPTPAKSPPCPLHEDGVSGHVLDVEDSLKDRGALTEPSTWEGKGREGKGKGVLSDESDDAPNRFEEFWDAYGNKVGRAKCETAYRQALKKKDVTDALLVAAASDYAQWCEDTDTFIKNPLTWLHGEHWNDEREPSTKKARPLTSVPEDHERPPDGLSPDEWAEWDHDRRQRAIAHRDRLMSERGLA